MRIIHQKHRKKNTADISQQCFVNFLFFRCFRTSHPERSCLLPEAEIHHRNVPQTENRHPQSEDPEKGPLRGYRLFLFFDCFGPAVGRFSLNRGQSAAWLPPRFFFFMLLPCRIVPMALARNTPRLENRPTAVAVPSP